MKSSSVFTAVSLAFIAATVGCASQPYQPQALPLRPESSIEISYLLGHRQHRLIVANKGDNASAQTFSERAILEHNVVDRARYEEFYRKAVSFVQTGHTGQRTVASSPICRSPYSIIIKNGPDTWTENGCRSNEEGGIGRLVRDGEFLLYSQK